MSQTVAAQLIAAGLSQSMAYHVASGARNVSVRLALWLLENDGIKVGPLAGKTKREIDVLRGLYEPRAPRSVQERRSANDPSPNRKAA